MRFAVAMSFCALFGLVAEGHPRSAKIVGDTLVWWPRDFRGEAVVPSDVRHIGSDAFSNCINLRNVIFGENSQLTEICDRAFENCSKLTAIDIPKTVRTIGSNDVFKNCYELRYININTEINNEQTIYLVLAALGIVDIYTRDILYGKK